MSDFDFERHEEEFNEAIDKRERAIDVLMWTASCVAAAVGISLVFAFDRQPTPDEAFEACLTEQAGEHRAEALISPDNYPYSEFTVEDKALVLDCWRQVDFDARAPIVKPD